MGGLGLMALAVLSNMDNLIIAVVTMTHRNMVAVILAWGYA